MQMDNKQSFQDNENTLLRLFIARLSFLRFDEKCLLESKVTTSKDLLILSLDELSLKVGRVLKTTLWHPEKIAKLTERDVTLMHMYGAYVIFYDSDTYPYLLRQIYDPPYALYCRGNVQALSYPSIAIVGTRKPSKDNADATKQLAKEIALAGISIVSGLAFGIDAQAHMGALLAQGSDLYGKTIAVLGSGVDNITPASNKRLAQAILASGGCIISEYPLNTVVQDWQFVQRNRIISALSRVILVMEAPLGSGALYTADFAIEHNRDLCFYKGALSKAVPASRAQIDLFGSKYRQRRSVDDYIQDGAALITTAQDVLTVVNSMTFLEERNFMQNKLDKINELL